MNDVEGEEQARETTYGVVVWDVYDRIVESEDHCFHSAKTTFDAFDTRSSSSFILTFGLEPYLDCDEPEARETKKNDCVVRLIEAKKSSTVRIQSVSTAAAAARGWRWVVSRILLVRLSTAAMALLLWWWWWWGGTTSMVTFILRRVDARFVRWWWCDTSLWMVIITAKWTNTAWFALTPCRDFIQIVHKRWFSGRIFSHVWSTFAVCHLCSIGILN